MLHEIVSRYERAGLCVIPGLGKLPYNCITQTKLKGWNTPRKYGPEYWQLPVDAVHVLLGEASKHPTLGALVDFDPDSTEAIGCYSKFLTPSSSFGRGGEVRHLLYWCSNLPRDFTRKSFGAKFELRANGHYTMFPGSRHPSGELVEWIDRRKTVQIDFSDLMQRLELMACELGVRPAEREPVGVQPIARGSDTFRRAAAYVRAMASRRPSIAGENGSGALFDAATALTRGFQLSDNEALIILDQEFNPYCARRTPTGLAPYPWSQRELARAIQNSRNHSRRPAGYLLTGLNHEKECG